MDENIFPVSLEDFCNETNVKELAVQEISKPLPTKKFHQFVKDFQTSIYIAFFQDPNGQKLPPLNKLKINTSLTEEKRLHYLKHIRYPVSFEDFQKYTNVMEIAQNILKKNGKKKEVTLQQIESIALIMFRNFYTLPKVRATSSIRLKPCSLDIKKIILDFATFDEANVGSHFISESNCSPETKKIVERTIKRKRTSESNKVINFCDQEQAPLSDDILEKFVDAFLARKKKDILKHVRSIAGENDFVEVKNGPLPKKASYLKLKRKDHRKTSSIAERCPSNIELLHSLKTFFEEKNQFYALSPSQNNNELNEQIVKSIHQLTIQEFRYFTHIYGLPDDVFNDDIILERCYRFAVKNPRVWPLNLYIALKDLFSFLETKNISYCNFNLENVSPRILMWNDLVWFTNYDECALSGILVCQREQMRKMFYHVCWAHDRWIKPCPKIIDPIMNDRIGNIHKTKVKIEPNISSLNKIMFQLSPNENSFDIIETPEEILMIGGDEDNNPTEMGSQKSLGAAERIGETRTKIGTIHSQNGVRKKIFFCALLDLIFFDNLSASEIEELNLQAAGLGQPLLQATINCNQKVTVNSNNFLIVFLSILKRISFMILADVNLIFFDLKSFRFQKYESCMPKSSTYSAKDIRYRVLYFFFSVLPNFCVCNLSFENCFPDRAICSSSEPDLCLSVSSRLHTYIKPSICEKIMSLKH